jgi:putative flippase GtrA
VSIRRWLTFNVVGAMGTAVQLGALVFLKSTLHMNYLLSTALAVEISVLHNFVWHERYTWPDGWKRSTAERVRSLAAFHLTNGLVSIVGNVLLMRLFVGHLRIPYFVANVMAIATCGLANFVLADRVAFNAQPQMNADQR